MGEGTLHWPRPLCHGPSAAVARQSVSPEPLGSQEPPPLSQKVPLLVMPLVVRRAGTPGVVVRCQLTNGQSASALACGTVSASHLSFRKRRV
jgi:hypothetical protein